VILIYKFSGKW